MKEALILRLEKAELLKSGKKDDKRVKQIYLNLKKLTATMEKEADTMADRLNKSLKGVRSQGSTKLHPLVVRHVLEGVGSRHRQGLDVER